MITFLFHIMLPSDLYPIIHCLSINQKNKKGICRKISGLCLYTKCWHIKKFHFAFFSNKIKFLLCVRTFSPFFTTNLIEKRSSIFFKWEDDDRNKNISTHESASIIAYSTSSLLLFYIYFHLFFSIASHSMHEDIKETFISSEMVLE